MRSVESLYEELRALPETDRQAVLERLRGADNEAAEGGGVGDGGPDTRAESAFDLRDAVRLTVEEARAYGLQRASGRWDPALWPEPPEVLYKYCDENGILVLRNLTLKVTAASALNDPFECLPGAGAHFGLHVELRERLARTPPSELDETLIRSMKASEEVFGAEIRDAKSVAGIMSEAYGLVSLAAQPLDLLMWSHYARFHTGMCIGFDVARLPESMRKVTPGPQPVRYQTQRPESPAHDNLRKGYFYGHALGLVTTKSDHWAYEEEFRAVVAFDDCKTFRTPGDAIHVCPIPPECLREVTVGVRMSPEARAEVFMELMSAERLAHVRVRAATLCPLTFALRVVDLGAAGELLERPERELTLLRERLA